VIIHGNEEESKEGDEKEQEEVVASFNR